MTSNPSDKFDLNKVAGRLNPCRKVRVVAKIRGYRETELGSSKTVPWISVNKSEGTNNVTISFGDQSASRKEPYLVDYCYEQKEDNAIIFSREVKPLITEIFEGNNATVIACGARGSGKTELIQGSSKKPGLAVLAMAEILSRVEENGKSVCISFYEANHQGHVCDLLDQERPEVLLFKDRAKVPKGISQVPVKSISEFQKLFFSRWTASKAAQKIAIEHPRRSHTGLIVHVLSQNEKSDSVHMGRMNFVDLAGYEDARRRSSNCRISVENHMINKSVHAFLNVADALNTNWGHVPYRESKLTYLLRDSLGGTSKLLMVACLSPSFCQDSLYILNLACRATVLDSAKKMKRSQLEPDQHLFERKASGTTSAIKGRKLFDKASHFTKSEKTSFLSRTISTLETSMPQEENSLEDVTKSLLPLSLDISFSDFGNDVESKPAVQKDITVQSEHHHEEQTPRANSCSKALSLIEEGQNTNKENNSSAVNNDVSPPLSTRLRELSNNLKSLYSSTPLSMKIPEDNDALFYSQVPRDIVEPRTPTTELRVRIDDRWDATNVQSPWETFSMHNSGIKNSLVQEYLSFLNTANKEELKRLKGVGEKRATYILELREESPEYFKSLDDLKDIGLSAKQIKGMMKKEVGELFD
ncbi:Kinesin-like protein [Quillaja saponaria]|uniref:Kinesin-like protein n=1 Tax=Quillaja saponaria TaxID=32244 RepID=A0AAD7Q3I6_QUISA|nr:Kinesin-like protein [Quillaja saponaria]